jgi:hypothetical protein
VSDAAPQKGARGVAFLGIGLAMGTSVGAAIGVAMDQIAIGVSIGISLGVAFGLLLIAASQKKTSAMPPEQGEP